MAKKKTSVDILAELEAKTEKTAEDLEKIDELKLQIEIDKEEAEKKTKKKNVPLALHQEFADLYFRKNRTKIGKFKREEALKQLSEEVKKCTGLKARKTQTLSIKGKLFKILADYPNPVEIQTVVESMYSEETAKKIMESHFIM